MAGQGQMYSFSDTVTTQRSVANYISIIDPQDVPCVSFFGTSNQSKFKFLMFPNHKYEWLQDTLRPRADQLAEALDNSETDVDVDDGTKFKPGDVILVDSEKMWVSAVATNTLTVVRGWGDTDAATHDDDSAVTYLFSARLEGDDSDATYWTTPTAPYNYSQILHAELKISGSEQNATSRYGINDQYAYQLMKWLGGAGGGGGRKGKAGDLMIDLEKTFFYGERIQRSSTVAGAMGGVKTFVTTNAYDAGGVQLTQDMLEDRIEACWTEGGKPDTIICNSKNKRLISSWYAGSVRTERSERTGGIVIDNIETEFGNLDLMMNRWCPTDEVCILERNKLGWVTLRDWFVEPLAKDGDYRKDQILGEFGFVVQNEEAHAVITGLALP